MADLESNINPTIGNTEPINSDIAQINDSNANLGEANQLEQVTSEQPLIEEPQQTNVLEQNQTISENQPDMTLTSTTEETNNNEIILGKFDNTNTAQESEISSQSDSLSEQPVTLGVPSPETNTEDPQKSKLAQKEKLLQLIKIHESKAKTKGFATGILSGVVLSVGILALSCIFAKDQIVSLLNGTNENPTLSASVVDLNENVIENKISKDEEEITYENEDEFYNYEDYEDMNNYEDRNSYKYDDNYEDITIPEYNEDLNEYTENSEEISNYEDSENINEENESLEDNKEALDEDSESIIPENSVENNYEDNIFNEEITIPEYDEPLEEENENIEDNELSEDTSPNINNGYNITRVNSIEEANWVLPSHCYDLTCYGEDKEFTPCTTFKLNEKLEENSNRIGNNGLCRYKDSSELVFVELK